LCLIVFVFKRLGRERKATEQRIFWILGNDMNLTAAAELFAFLTYSQEMRVRPSLVH
jgi:hypothetical protein